MAENSKIAWTTHTFNPWTGCTKVSPGCTNCYAESQVKRWGGAKWGVGQERVHTSAGYWHKPFKWDRDAAASGERPRVFCASLADVFDPEVPDTWRDEVLGMIAATPNLDWLLLTKRPEVARVYLNGLPERIGARFIRPTLCGNAAGLLEARGEQALADKLYRRANELAGRGHSSQWPLPNLWLGTTVEDGKRGERVADLLRTKAAVHFLSCEPQIADLNIRRLDSESGDQTDALNGFTEFKQNGGARVLGVDWVIVGGESGHGARPFALEWARKTIEACREDGVAVFFKQTGCLVVPQTDDDTFALHGSDVPGLQTIDMRKEWFGKDPKGDQPEHWPEDLNIRQVPCAPATRTGWRW